MDERFQVISYHRRQSAITGDGPMIDFRFNTDEWKPPPWVVFPEVSPEDYPRPDKWNEHADEWTTWFCSLSQDERWAYEDHYPEPDGWQDFYRFVWPHDR